MDRALRDLLQRLFALALVVAASAALGQEPASEATPGWDDFVRPVLEGGQGGRVFFPRDPADGGVGILDPGGFNVHMTNADAPGEERVVPAGQTFVPPSGRWRYWLQGEWLMSPFSMLRVTPAAEWRNVSVSTLPVAPAGRVGLDPAIGRDLELWLLYSGNSPGWRHHELSRRRSVAEAIEGVLMPAGPVVAGLWDGREERYVALSGEFTVMAEEMVQAPLVLPTADEASALVHVTVPLGVRTEALADFEATLSRDGQVIRPEFRVVTNWGVYQGWRDVPPGPALLAGGNELLYLDARTIDLAGGGVAWVGEPLVPRPSLEVTLVLPRQLREQPFSLEVRRLPAREPLARAELPRQAGRHRFQDGLVNAPLEIELMTHLGVYRQQVDLSNGGEASLEISPELIEVYGTVRRGGERQSARVSFQTVTGENVTAVANEDGEYSVIALQPLTWVDIQPVGIEQEPWRDFYMPPIRSSQVLDFDIPDAEMTVRVLDAGTRKGIAGSTVGVRNEHWPPDQLDTAATARGRGRVIATSHTADDDGEVRLPPPRPGRIEIHVDAPGYRPLDEPISLDVPDPPSDRELEISLDPIGASVPIRLVLPDGSPAAGARVARVDTLALERTFFSGRADASGVVEVPIEPANGLLLLKHSDASFGIVQWQEWKDREHVEWAFPPAAAQPLTVRFLDPTGETPAARAAITIWVEDRKLSPTHQLRLLYVDQETGGGLRHELSRRRTVAEVGEGILMPAGRVIASLWDPREGRYAAISRPFVVEAGKTVVAPVRQPTGGEADLVVYVDRAEGVSASALPGLVLTAAQGGKQKTADVTLTTPWGMYGVWYGLKPGTVAIGGANDRLYVSPATVRLTGGQIGRYQNKVLPQILIPADAAGRR